MLYSGSPPHCRGGELKAVTWDNILQVYGGGVVRQGQCSPDCDRPDNRSNIFTAPGGCQSLKFP